MTESEIARGERRLLLLPPTARDGETTRALLADAGLATVVCKDFRELEYQLGGGAGAILLTEEAAAAYATELGRRLDRQPPWSDLPLLVLTRAGADSDDSAQAARELGNVTLIERPVRVATLLSAVRSALRARDRQYQIRDQLAERARNETSLREADRRKDEFLATLGHELRNPLSPLATSAALLVHTAPGNEEVSAVAGVIQRQVAHLKRLVDDLLEVSRITRGQIEVRRDGVDLGEILRAALESAQPSLEQANHTLVVELPTEPLPLRGDAVRLTQVFANLLQNAAKYTEEGGRIELRVRREGPHVRVEVADDGIGIAPENLASIFEMFTQVDRASRRTQGGLGIGLTLARSLVSMHGGRISCRSAGPGRGSTFEVELPLAEAAESRVVSGEDLPDFAGWTMLVADDNRDAADALSSLLRTLGAQVTAVHGGPEALESFERLRPHAAVLDIGMPHMDGYEVARRIRAADWGDDATLIALSGWGQGDDVRRAEAAGFDAHLVKPANIAELHRRLTARRRGSRALHAARLPA